MARWTLVVGFAALACAEGQRPGDGSVSEFPDTSFAGLIAALSEEGGYFDTDNLISNESSYLHVLDGLEAREVEGGAYIGVGPDQNFAYIAAVRPAMAFIVDIRRDNVLEHLLFKALFELNEERAGYLADLLGRPDSDVLDGQPVDVIVTYLDTVPRTPADADRAVGAVQGQIATFGVPLSAGDLATVERFHRAFIAEGLNLQFHSYGRPPQPYYPTLRDLLRETNRSGEQVSLFTSDSAYGFVRSLQVQDRVIPVVGDLAGGHAVRAIGRLLRERGLAVSAFYTSNVEFYLYGEGTFPVFARNVASLPVTPDAVIIRSVFGRGFGAYHPYAVPGYASTQVLQPIDTFLEIHQGPGFRGYWDLVTRGALAPAAN